ncbi:hypothetical protein CDO44_00330 [Pigmentiphaga sp. NML080357]|uniref:Bug family tripartite tricarboxylate transporter substrate binding protein n=1 Tax=Pigmentiphaga sp. NML080357 TaxID=2008675 RepID=UPI000B41F9A9|nr:tripartite tricarboxylate transporter substrate binding protein [Pigmentiphaga sp. NML080357]OVZ64697.1 hypothetical protein CDO44_00330 [Pigmentiphaga sp. NML080357]
MIRAMWHGLMAAILLTPPSLAAGDYPERPVRLVVPFVAGGSIDRVARLLAERIQAKLGQPVVVDNRTGATGNIGTQAVVAAPPDGHTLLMQTSALAISPWLSRLPFDVEADLVPVTRIARTPYALVVRKSLPVESFEAFVAYAAAHPGKLTCSSYGVGSPPHLALELIKQAASVEIVHAPYRSFSQAVPSLVSGQLDCSIDTPTNVQPQVETGVVRVLGVTAAEPFFLFPSATPMASRYPGTEVEGFQLLFAAKGTPPAIVGRVRAEFARVLRDPEVEKQLRAMGFVPVGDDPRSAAEGFEKDYARFGRLIKERGIRAE